MTLTALNYLNFFSFILTIGVNYLTSTGVKPFKSLSNISDTYTTSITPPDWTFGIWGLIYFGILLFSIGQMFPKLNLQSTIKNINFWFILSCVCNVTWLLLFTIANKQTFITSFGVMIVLLISLFVIQRKAQIFKNKKFTYTKLFLIDIPFSLYLGWIIFACFANLGIVIKSQVPDFNQIFLFLVFGLMLTLIYTANLYFNNNYVTQLVFMYALFALIIKYRGDNSLYSFVLIGIFIFSALCLIIKILLDGKFRKIEKSTNLYDPLV